VYLGVWSEAELAFANRLGTSPIDPAEYVERLKWTRAPRYLFLETSAWDEHISTVKATSGALFDMEKFNVFRNACCGQGNEGVELSHKVIAVISGETVFDCTLDFHAPAVKDCVLNQIMKRTKAKRKKLFDNLMSVDIGHTLAGHMFENFLHGFLPKNIDGVATALGVHTESVPSFGKKAFTEVVFDVWPSSLLPNVYYRPLIPNFACIDSFAIHSNGDVVAHQHTVGNDHPIKADKLVGLLHALKFDGTTKSLHIVFVVPNASSCTTLQTYAGKSKLSKKEQNLIDTRIFQYRREVQFK
jgi:hypothetical protein